MMTKDGVSSGLLPWARVTYTDQGWCYSSGMLPWAIGIYDDQGWC